MDSKGCWKTKKEFEAARSDPKQRRLFEWNPSSAVKKYGNLFAIFQLHTKNVLQNILNQETSRKCSYLLFYNYLGMETLSDSASTSDGQFLKTKKKWYVKLYKITITWCEFINALN